MNFYGSRFSPNMTRTPEGYLICHNVPIARTGWYKYLGQELNLNDYYDKMIDVYRSPEEVFSPSAIASFEGKSVTDDHPSEDVRPDNYSAYEKGHVTNVRRGAGKESDCLVADLYVKDPILISEIETGKREVSCGYDCIYEEIEPGKYNQRQICGNHVAVVTNGRAGSRIAIKDNKPKEGSKKKTMAKHFLGKMFAAWAKDAEPEEIEKAMDEMGLSANKADPAKPVKDEGGAPDLTAVITMIQDLAAKVDALIESDKSVHTEVPKDALDALEVELEKPEEEVAKDGLGEEAVTVAAEEMNKEEKTGGSADRAIMLNTVRAMKPVIAAMKDAAEKKRATDALVASIRAQMSKTTNDGSYAGILKMAQANAAAAKAKDGKAKDNKENDPTDFGRNCAERNPHRNKGGK